MKLSVAVAATNALPSAFVVFRGFEASMRKASQLGYEGVELALKEAGEINGTELSGWLKRYDLEVSCISTGQVYADTGLMFTDADTQRRRQVIKIFCELIDLAADFGQKVNIGRIRGRIDHDRAGAIDRFNATVTQLCEYADRKDVTLILEPVNRYEIDFINSVSEGAALLKSLQLKNLKLMPDTFHMNIEDRSIGETLATHISDIDYIHLADSNRLAPGKGHLDFPEIFKCLLSVKYQGWVSLEILPKPDPERAASQAADYLIPLIKDYNRALERN